MYFFSPSTTNSAESEVLSTATPEKKTLTPQIKTTQPEINTNFHGTVEINQEGEKKYKEEKAEKLTHLPENPDYVSKPAELSLVKPNLDTVNVSTENIDREGLEDCLAIPAFDSRSTGEDPKTTLFHNRGVDQNDDSSDIDEKLQQAIETLAKNFEGDVVTLAGARDDDMKEIDLEDSASAQLLEVKNDNRVSEHKEISSAPGLETNYQSSKNNQSSFKSALILHNRPDLSEYEDKDDVPF